MQRLKTLISKVGSDFAGGFQRRQVLERVSKASSMLQNDIRLNFIREDDVRSFVLINNRLQTSGRSFANNNPHQLVARA